MTPKRISLISIAILLAATLIAGPAFLTGCGTSPANTAYVGETAGYVTLKAAADGYKAWLAAGGKPTIAQAAQAHSLFAAAQQAELTAIDATVATGTTNSPASSAAQTQTITDLVSFLKSIGVSL